MILMDDSPFESYGVGSQPRGYGLEGLGGGANPGAVEATVAEAAGGTAAAVTETAELTAACAADWEAVVALMALFTWAALLLAGADAEPAAEVVACPAPTVIPAIAPATIGVTRTIPRNTTTRVLVGVASM
jgi:hypothetical protein